MIYARDPWYALSIAALVLIAVAAVVVRVTAGTSPDVRAVVSTATPRATEAVATATAAPTETPDADSVQLDFVRALELGTIRDALTAYADDNGAFPSTNGELVVLCDADGDGPGCVLTAYNTGVPFNDGLSPYWYASDGVTFTLVGIAALPQPSNGDCPAELPSALSNAHVMCMNGGQG
jgi:hypothetical protein